MTSGTFNSLLRRIQQGDMSALQPIYSAYYKSMCNQALWIVHNKSDAQDVASDSLLKLVKYAQRPEHAEVKDCGAFIYTLVRNTALDFVRSRSRTAELADVPVERGDGIEQIALSDAMKGLSEQDFKIVELFYFYDCKIKTVAEQTGLSVSAVKWHLADIRKKLYKILRNS